jgi:hypothetical protein
MLINSITAGCEKESAEPTEFGGEEGFECFLPSPFDGFAVNLNPTHVGKTAQAVTASGSQIHEADLVDFRQIDLVQQSAFGLNLFDIQLQPANIAKVKLAFVKIERKTAP